MAKRSRFTEALNFIIGTPLGRPIAAGYLRALTSMEALRRSLMPTEVALMEAIMGNYLSQAVYVAARLGIADLLEAGPLSVNDLAAKTEVNADHLFRLLRFLSAKGIFRQKGDGRFEVTRLAKGLRADTTSSFKAFAEMNGSAPNWRAWGALEGSIRTGQAAFTLTHGTEFFDYMKSDPEFSALFDKSMIGFAEATIPLIAKACRFDSGTVVDVGGGHGGLLAGILRRHPALKGVLYDLPDVVKDAPGYLQHEGVAERVKVEGGSFFDAVPAGHDYYVLKNVLHDWGDPECLKILGNVSRAIKPDGRLVLCELLVRDHEAYPISRSMDMGMMVLTRGGRERTRLEYDGLLAKTGFVLREVISTTDFMSMLIASPAARRE